MIPADDPIAAFIAAFERAKAVEPHDATAMTLATVDARGLSLTTNTSEPAGT